MSDPMPDPRALVTMPIRLGFAATGIAFGTVESAVNIARVAANSIESEVNNALGLTGGGEIANVRAPLMLLAQVADQLLGLELLTSAWGPGGSLLRLLALGLIMAPTIVSARPAAAIATSPGAISSTPGRISPTAPSTSAQPRARMNPAGKSST